MDLYAKRDTKGLIKLLNDRQRDDRAQICHLLGQIGDPEAVKPLLAQLDDPADLVRSASLESLGYFAARLNLGRDNTAKIGNLLLQDGYFMARVKAARALAAIADYAERNDLWLLQGDAEEYMLEAYQSREDAVHELLEELLTDLDIL
jgi:HEAT repeat protein